MTPKDVFTGFLLRNNLFQPLVIYLAISPLLLIVALLGGWIADIGHPGGEARGMTFAANTIDTIPWLYALASFLLLITRRLRNLPCLLLNGAVLALTGISLWLAYHSHHEEYNMRADDVIRSGDTIRVEREYYHSTQGFDTLRSIKQWRNGQPDSVWTIYSREGNVLERIAH